MIYARQLYRIHGIVEDLDSWTLMDGLQDHVPRWLPTNVPGSFCVFLTVHLFLVSFTHTCDLISFSIPCFPLLISQNSFYSCFVTSVDWIHQCFETTFPPPNAVSYSLYVVNIIAGCLRLHVGIISANWIYLFLLLWSQQTKEKKIGILYRRN